MQYASSLFTFKMATDKDSEIQRLQEVCEEYEEGKKEKTAVVAYLNRQNEVLQKVQCGCVRMCVLCVCMCVLCVWACMLCVHVCVLYVFYTTVHVCAHVHVMHISLHCSRDTFVSVFKIFPHVPGVGKSATRGGGP